MSSVFIVILIVVLLACCIGPMLFMKKRNAKSAIDDNANPTSPPDPN